jgi:hypothetical protein
LPQRRRIGTFAAVRQVAERGGRLMRKYLVGCLLIGVVGCRAEVVHHQGKTLDAWRQALHDTNPAARIAAAEALRELGPKAEPAVPDLVGALDDPDAKVRAKAATSNCWRSTASISSFTTCKTST